MTEKMVNPLTVEQVISSQDAPDVSVAKIELDGTNSKVKNTKVFATYSIVAGTGYFLVWNGQDCELKEVEAGDIMRIPAGTPYQDMGKMTMICINYPAFNPEQVEFLD